MRPFWSAFTNIHTQTHPCTDHSIWMVREKATELPQYKLQTNSFEKSTKMKKKTGLFKKKTMWACVQIYTECENNSGIVWIWIKKRVPVCSLYFLTFSLSLCHTTNNGSTWITAANGKRTLNWTEYQLERTQCIISTNCRFILHFWY